MPIVLLPYSQYLLSLLVAVIVVGPAIAGVVARRLGGTALVAVGVLVVQLIATMQTAMTVESGLSDRRESTFYLAALVGGNLVAILLGMVVLVLIARAPRAGAVVGVSIAAIALGPWLSGIVVPFGVVVIPEPIHALLGIARVVPAIVIGLAIAWAGLRTAGRIVAAIVGILLLWVGPALITAVSAAAGTRVLAPYPAEMLEYGVGVFRQVIVMPELSLLLPLVGIAVAFVGLTARRTVAARRAAAGHTATGTPPTSPQ
jgi:hypothetical protein